MPKLPIVSGDYIMLMLERHGFLCVGIKGSHHKYKKTSSQKTYITTVPRHKELDQITLKSLLRQSGFDYDQFLNYYNN